MPRNESDATFAPLLSPFRESTLSEHDGAVFGVWPDLRLAYLNSSWFRFASENGGEPAISARWKLGTSIDSALAGPLEDFYTIAFRKCLDTRTCWEHLYECSSPALFRRFHMKVYPLGDKAGLLVVNSIVLERPHASHLLDQPPPAAMLYRDRHGIAHMCVHCRRYRREDHPARWDWIKDWVSSAPSKVSHGLCPVCYDYHYPPNLQA